MTAVMVCWVLAMASGLSWARLWTGFLTLVTVAAFAGLQSASLGAWHGWFQLGVLGLTPWLLAAERRRDQVLRRQLQARESQRLSELSTIARSALSLQTANQQLERQIAEVADVYHVSKETARALHRNELFALCAEVVPRLLRIRGLRLMDLSEERSRVFRAAASTDDRMEVGEPGEPGDLDAWIVQQVQDSRQAGWAAPAHVPMPLPEGVTQLGWAPLWQGERLLGVVAAEEMPQRQAHMLTLVANQLSLQLARIRLYEQVEEMAETDALTGLAVRRAFMERAQEEVARSKRHELACAVLMLDLDRFKEKNDTYGHLVGDVVLKDVARLLQRNLREIDLIARYGGEEFIILLVETTIEQAMLITLRLQQLVEVHPVRAYDELLHQTISIGVSAFPQDAQTLENLIECADRALYEAKRTGRNRVVRWSAATMAA
ncbi:MAG: GGDEF domain-containing protein [Candidatus Omnitrophica bacterium]|nr:GGDEF domain-containing protein [Candidatus Omnitrophota bacterium]